MQAGKEPLNLKLVDVARDSIGLTYDGRPYPGYPALPALLDSKG
jgi:hypothetical protein